MDAKQLPAYRQLAFERLQQLLFALPEKAHEVDSFVDQTIRNLSKLASRPANTPPYIGLYGAKPELDEYREYRSVAVDRLKELMLKQPSLIPADADLDKYLRVLTKLPPRPADVEPYMRLFVLRPANAAPDSLQVAQGFSTAQQLVTAQQLMQIVGDGSLSDQIKALTPGVNATFAKFNINTRLRMAHFLAQVMHESGGFRWLKEIWGPTDDQLSYEGRLDLGNTQPGDGRRFMGRGLIQLTGRANYQAFSKAIGVDCVSKPELLESSPYAVLAAGWFWNRNNLNALADEDGIRRITRTINGGLNGLEDRARYLDRAKLVLK